MIIKSFHQWMKSNFSVLQAIVNEEKWENFLIFPTHWSAFHFRDCFWEEFSLEISKLFFAFAAFSGLRYQLIFLHALEGTKKCNWVFFEPKLFCWNFPSWKFNFAVLTYIFGKVQARVFIDITLQMLGRVSRKIFLRWRKFNNRPIVLGECCHGY